MGSRAAVAVSSAGAAPSFGTRADVDGDGKPRLFRHERDAVVGVGIFNGNPGYDLTVDMNDTRTVLRRRAPQRHWRAVVFTTLPS